MQRTTRLKVLGVVGAVALAIAVPVALAQAQAGEETPPAAETAPDDLICFEIGGPESWDLGGDWAEEAPPLPEEFLEEINREAAELAAHLDAAGIPYELTEGPMGETWVEWDYDDGAANAAVEEFYGDWEGHGFEVFEFEGETPFEMFGFDGELPFEMFGFDGELPFEMFEFEVGGPFGGEICIETPAAQAGNLAGEFQELMDAFTEAGVSFDTRTIEIEVPVWDLDDDAARAVVEEFFGSVHFDESFAWLDTEVLSGAGS